MNEISRLAAKAERLSRMISSIRIAAFGLVIIAFLFLLVSLVSVDLELLVTLSPWACISAGLGAGMILLSILFGGQIRKIDRELAKVKGKTGPLAVCVRRAAEFTNLTVRQANLQGEEGSKGVFTFDAAAAGRRKIEVSGVWKDDGKTYKSAGMVEIVADRVGSLTISLLDEPDRAYKTAAAEDGGLTVSLLDEPDRANDGTDEEVSNTYAGSDKADGDNEVIIAGGDNDPSDDFDGEITPKHPADWK